jgi:hypothetical protein
MPLFTAADLAYLSRASAQKEKERLQVFSDALCQYVISHIDKDWIVDELSSAIESDKDPAVPIWSCPVRTWTIPWSQYAQTRAHTRDVVLASTILREGWNTEIGLPDGRWCSVIRLFSRSDFLDRLSEALGPNFKVFWRTTDRIHTQSEFVVSKAVLTVRYYPTGRPHTLAWIDHSTDQDYGDGLRLRGHEPIRTPPSTPRLMSNPPPVERPNPTMSRMSCLEPCYCRWELDSE